MEFQAYDVALVPLIVSLVGVFRAAGLPVRWLPFTAIVLGLAAGFVYIAPEDPRQAVLFGLIMGTSAIGAYSGCKNTFRK
ncbi:hypothetical protein DUZ99_07160 [Xylanibacillus composti]|uniref:Holin n=1 Tax=Xylanibacillus composti TaxID=1572762 RepID=A0A8J4M3U7_9BACL|nr:hypothetical protein [Xylanibacillus composti]MDT9724771.1 hypothetical protein [Xylanibacillus composti]GIQ69876.1 hypothetical protein XYCOK13_27000 [Xylanibacillus composti]